MFPLGADTTYYRLLTSEHVGTRQVDGREILEVDTRALTLLADQAMRDCQHLLRPSHLAQLRRSSTIRRLRRTIGSSRSSC
jgi:fumarate hydratase class I